MRHLPESSKAEFENGYWTITRSNRRFSCIPIDQALEQANKRVMKGVGGIIGLTENPGMLERWIVTGPEISCVVEDFDPTNDNDNCGINEEVSPSQRQFQHHGMSKT